MPILLNNEALSFAKLSQTAIPAILGFKSVLRLSGMIQEDKWQKSFLATPACIFKGWEIYVVLHDKWFDVRAN